MALNVVVVEVVDAAMVVVVALAKAITVGGYGCGYDHGHVSGHGQRIRHDLVVVVAVAVAMTNAMGLPDVVAVTILHPKKHLDFFEVSFLWETDTQIPNF